MDEEATSYPAPQRRPIVRKLAKEPSWILLGFLLGAAFVWLLPTSDDPKRVPATSAQGADGGTDTGGDAGAPTAGAATAGNGSAGGQRAGERRALPVRRLSTIEAVFEAWGHYAVWEHDLTQVALWSAEHGGYAECYEVMRSGDVLYFRSIPKLSRPVINYGTQITSPLLYTETETTRAARAGGVVVPLSTPPTAAKKNNGAQEGGADAGKTKRKRAPVEPPAPRRVDVTLPEALVPPPPPPLQAPELLVPETPTQAPAPATEASPAKTTTTPPPPKTSVEPPPSP